MPIVNYIREHRRFIQYASDEKLTANERLLWYALMEIFNQRADGNDWPDDFIRISNDRVLTLCPMGFDTMAKARNGLKQRGLIEFKAGDKNKANPAYRIHYFYPDSYSKFTDNIQDNMRGNTGDNMQGNTQGNMRGNPGGNIRDIYPNQNNIYTYTKTEKDEEDDEDEDSTARARGLMPTIRDGFQRSFGILPNPIQLARLVNYANLVNFTADMVISAMEIAAGKGAESPADYTLSVLADWWENDVMLPEQIDEYRFLNDAQSGRNPYGSGDAAEDYRKCMEARNRRIEQNRERGIPCCHSGLRMAEG